MTKITVCYYSLTGHVHRLAEAVSEGIKAAGCEVNMCRVPETLSPEIIEKMHATEKVKAMSHVPVCTLDDLAEADGIIFGTPTRFGNMAAQMREFLDSTGRLWSKKALVGKVGSVFTSSATQHGGQEATILSFHITLLHHGMVVAGLPYIYDKMNKIDAVNGCSPYGSSTIAGNKGERDVSADEFEGAKFQGKYVALFADTVSKRRDYILGRMEEQ